MWFGVELFLLLMLFYIVVGVALVAGIAALLIAVFKVKIKFKELIFIMLLFLVVFSISSFVMRGREDEQIVYRTFLGDNRAYEGAYVYYGFPEIWMQKFEPYDVDYRNLFSLPANFYFLGFFIDFTVWLTISFVAAYHAMILLTKTRKKDARSRLGLYKPKPEATNTRVHGA